MLKIPRYRRASVHTPMLEDGDGPTDAILTWSFGTAGSIWGPFWGQEKSITCQLSQMVPDLGSINRDWPGALFQEDRGRSLPGL